MRKRCYAIDNVAREDGVKWVKECNRKYRTVWFRTHDDSDGTIIMILDTLTKLRLSRWLVKNGYSQTLRLANNRYI